jgi:hypothetical protein
MTYYQEVWACNCGRIGMWRKEYDVCPDCGNDWLPRRGSAKLKKSLFSSEWVGLKIIDKRVRNVCEYCFTEPCGCH